MQELLLKEQRRLNTPSSLKDPRGLLEVLCSTQLKKLRKSSLR